jgi:hypothetical protein
MAESAKTKQSIEAFKQFLSEAIKDKDAILLGEDGNIYLAGVVGIVQEVTQGLMPLYLSRTLAQAARITKKLKSENINYLTICSNKHNLTDDEPRGEQMLFEWGYSQDLYPDKHEWLNLGSNENQPIMVTSSFSFVGKIRHRGWPKI